MTDKKRNTAHGWFFQYVNSICPPDEAKEKRRELVREYSGGKTDSLAELYDMYPRIYEVMRADLYPGDTKIRDPLDMPRKRLIAALFEYLENKEKEKPPGQRKTITVQYVKAVASVAAKAENFNSISLPGLRSLYFSIGQKNMQKWDVAVRDLINATL